LQTLKFIISLDMTKYFSNILPFPQQTARRDWKQEADVKYYPDYIPWCVGIQNGVLKKKFAQVLEKGLFEILIKLKTC